MDSEHLEIWHLHLRIVSGHKDTITSSKKPKAQKDFAKSNSNFQDRVHQTYTVDLKFAK